MKKSIINTYETIYFIDIVVANKYSTLKELQKLYCYSDKEELTEEILAGQCTTTQCIRKSDNKPVELIKYNKDSNIVGIDKSADLVNTVCHEAGHAVLDIYENIGQPVCNCSSEPFCYLLGFIGECIYKTMKKK